MKYLILLLSLLLLTACGANTQTTQDIQQSTTQDTEAGLLSQYEYERLNFEIGIIQIIEHPALDAARYGFMQALSNEGFYINWDYQNAQGDSTTLSTISQRFVNNNVDIVLAIGTGAAQSIAAETEVIPIVGTAITSYEAAGLVISNDNPGFNVTGASDMNPIAAQVELMLEFVPNATVIGVIYSSNEPNATLQAEIAKEHIAYLGLAYDVGTITNINDIQQVTTSIANRVDAIWIPTDNQFASSMALVYQISVDSGVPVFPAEGNMVMTGGVATLSIDYWELGYLSGTMAAQILRDEAEPSTMPIQFLEHYVPIINGHLVSQLGITVPPHLLQYVTYP